MCGRFVYREDPRDLARRARLPADDPALEELGGATRYNIAPSQPILGVRSDGGDDRRGNGRCGAVLRWGLVPSWADDEKIGNRLINARAESVFEKPAFRAAARRRRCVIPASGFYEWQRAVRGGKQPFYIHRSGGEPLFFAGLWERWDGGDEPLETACLLTTDANEWMEPIHDRMPVILDAEGVGAWIDPGGDPDGLRELLRPCPAGRLAGHPVSTRVNSPSHDDPALLDPAETQGDLFGEEGGGG